MLLILAFEMSRLLLSSRDKREEEEDGNDDDLRLEVEREEEDYDDEEDGNDDGLGSSILDPPFRSTFPVPPASIIIFRNSALSLAFSEDAAVLAFDGFV